MRLTRAVLTAAAAALAPALVLTTPALAATQASPASATASAPAASSTSVTYPVDSMSDDEVRSAILRIIGDLDTGASVFAAAQRAMDGTIEDQRTFLGTGLRLAQAEDDRVAIFRLLAAADPATDKAVVREINKALDAGTPEALRAYLETGHRLAVAEDDRVAVFRLLADPATTPAVRAAAQAALDDGSPEALRYFLETGRFEADA